MRSTIHHHDDPDHPGRVTSSTESPLFTADDRALLIGLQLYENTLCSGCGEPKDTAWHSEAEGWYEAPGFVCHGCAALRGGPEHAVYHDVRLRDGAEERLAHLDPVEIGVNTTEAPEPATT